MAAPEAEEDVLSQPAIAADDNDNEPAVSIIYGDDIIIVIIL